jgi:probable F420-dependent oxidoreductase
MSRERRPVRVGVQLAPQHTSWKRLREAAVRVEEAGADLLFNWDHFHPLSSDAGRRGWSSATLSPRSATTSTDSGDPDGAHLECWTTLAAWAELTERIELGPMVSAIGYRNPDLLADMARTVDQISGGRLVLGVGAGFKEREYLDYGYEFPPGLERLEQLEDGLSRIRSRLDLLNPPPVRRIPLLVGGGGERRTLRVVARHADIWNTFAEGQDFHRKSRALDRHCTTEGRDPTAIERSVLVGGDPREVGAPLVALGATLLVVLVHHPFDLGVLRNWLRWRDQVNAD